VILEDCQVGTTQMLGEQGEGFVDALRLLDGGRISIAAMALGIAQGALDCSLAYVKDREQFNRPIAEFQGIRFKLADMATRIEAARTLTYQAATLKQELKSVPKWSSMAKLFASETAVWVAEQSVQVHGGYGYTKDYPAEKYWRDSKVCTIGEGTSEIQRMVIARELLK
jgi:alkylation response protein AidB-like acyl-CoA dehydrogenase